MRNRFKVALVAAMAAVMIPAVTHASTEDRLLALVPPDAISVAMVRVDDMRRSPIAQSVFAKMRAGSRDAEAERLLREAGLDPARDVDAILITMSPSAHPDRPRFLVAASGRFDPARLGRLIESRGGIRKSSGGATYFLAPERVSTPDGDPAISFLGSDLVLAGTEDAVVATLAAVRSAKGRFATSTLGREMHRIPPHASGWMLFDVQRAKSLQTIKAPGASPFGEQSLAAVKNVSTVSAWLAESGDKLEFGSAAVARDAETRALVQDVLKGLLASMRIAAQEKQPALVKVVRGFTIGTEGDAVSLSGTVPTRLVGDFVAKLQ